MSAFWLVGIWWLIPAIVKFTQVSYVFAIPILIALCFFIALPYVLIGWLIANKQWLYKPFGIIFISASYAVMTLVFPNPIPGNIAHSLYQYPIFLQLLDVGGVAIVLFLVVFVNWQIVKAIHSFQHNRQQAEFSLLRGVLVLAIVCVYGALKIGLYEGGNDKTIELKIGMVQPKLLREDNIERLYSLSERLVAQNPDIDLLVWPEFPTAFSYVGNSWDKQKVDYLIAKLNKPVVIVSGYIYEEGADPNDSASRYYNTAHLIDENRVLKSSYQKQELVPFFEYLPREQQWPFLRELFPEALRYIPGNEANVFHLDSNTRIIPLICYETIFPQLTREFIQKDGNIIINLVNDIWLGDQWASSYHFAVGLFRSIEHRVPWVRVSNSGISGMVSASGVIDSATLTAQQVIASRVFDVEIPSERSFYSRYGDIFLFGLLVVILIGTFNDKMRKVLKVHRRGSSESGI